VSIGRRALGFGLALLVGTLTLAGCHPAPLVVIDDVTGGEHPMAEFSKVRFQVRLVPGAPGASNTSHNSVEVYCTTVGGTATAGADFVSLTGGRCATIAPGQQGAFFNVKVVDDNFYEAVEKFSVTLRIVGAGVQRGTATGTITNNDAPPPP
jgi:Calx-beta domain